MNKENCALKLVDEIILYYDARSKKHQITLLHVSTLSRHPQGACNQYLAKLHKYFKFSCR